MIEGSASPADVYKNEPKAFRNEKHIEAISSSVSRAQRLAGVEISPAQVWVALRRDLHPTPGNVAQTEWFLSTMQLSAEYVLYATQNRIEFLTREVTERLNALVARRCADQRAYFVQIHPRCQSDAPYGSIVVSQVALVLLMDPAQADIGETVHSSGFDAFDSQHVLWPVGGGAAYQFHQLPSGHWLRMR